MAKLSRVLVELKGDCDMPVALEDMKLAGIPPEPLAEFLDHPRLHFAAEAAGRGPGQPGPARPISIPPRPRWRVRQLPRRAIASLCRICPPWIAAPMNACSRWNGWKRGSPAREACIWWRWIPKPRALDAMAADLVGVSPRARPERCLLHSASRTAAATCSPKSRSRWTARRRSPLLKPLLESEAVLKVGQNIKYDINVLARYGVMVAPVDDTMVMSFDLDAGRSEDGIGGVSGHGMDELSERHLGHTTLAFKDVCGTGKKAIPFGEVPLDKATQYAAEDADVTWRLHAHLTRRLPEEGATRVYERVDRPLIPVVAAMEREGIKVDRSELARLSEEFASRNRPAGEGSPRAGGAGIHHRQPQAAGRHSVRKAWLQGRSRRARAGNIRPTRACSNGWPPKARPCPTRCSNTASSRSSRAPIPMRCSRDQPAHRARPHQLQPGRRADRAAVLDRSQPAEHPDPHRNRAADSQGLRARRRQRAARRRLFSRSNCGWPHIWPMSIR